MRSAHSRPVTVGLATGLFVITSGVTGTALATTTPSTTTPSATVSASRHGQLGRHQGDQLPDSGPGT